MTTLQHSIVKPIRIACNLQTTRRMIGVLALLFLLSTQIFPYPINFDNDRKTGIETTDISEKGIHQSGSSVTPNLVLSTQSFDIWYYDLFFEIDPANDLFNAHQNITFSSALGTDRIHFILHSDLQVTSVRLVRNDSYAMRIEKWYMKLAEAVEGKAGMMFDLLEVQIQDLIKHSVPYYLLVDYYLDPEAVESNVGDEIFRFTVSEKGTRALGWPSGVVPILVNEDNYAANHEITIKHPSYLSCMISGQRTSVQKDETYTTESYLSQRVHPVAPSFVCDKYQIKSKTVGDLSVEFFTESDDISDEIIGYVLEGLVLFKDQLYDNGDRHFQFGFVDVGDSRQGGTTRHDTIFMRSGITRSPLGKFKTDTMVLANLFHEIAHSWNGYVLGESWENEKYFLWYQEGGANFLSAWALENTLGTEAAKLFRQYNLHRYREVKGWESSYNIENVPNGGLDTLADSSIAYEYAGQVWEQLSLKLGKDVLLDGLYEFNKRYWFNASVVKEISIDELFDTLETDTDTDIETYLQQWTESNAQIKLSLSDTDTKEVGEKYETTVEVFVDTDKDYEIFTFIGYQTSSGSNLVPITLSHRGSNEVTLVTDEKPSSVVIDPDYRVPRSDVVDMQLAVLTYGIRVLVVAVPLLIISFIGYRFYQRRKGGDELRDPAIKQVA